MQIVSFWFIIFFCVTAFIYYILPAKVRYIWLFAASLFFYLTQGPAHTLFLVFSALTTWLGGLKITSMHGAAGKKRAVVAAVIAANLAVLLYFKYIGFLSGGLLKSPILPIGISFYTFQAIGYLIDVYRGEVEPERNPVRYMLFVAFFPTVLSGPIERAGRLIHCFTAEYQEGIRFDVIKIRDGLVMMVWGFFMKLVLADRLAAAVDTVFGSPSSYGGIVLFIASILFSLQIYLDFAGYSSIVIGAARVLGIRLIDNFNAPYLSENIGEFWRRWHISLSTWLRDYLYISLGGSRRGEPRKLLNLMIVFIISGLWHGAGFTFILWGLIHGLYQVLYVLWKKLPGKRPDCPILSTAVSFLLVNFAWIFFRADSVKTAAAFFAGLARPLPVQLFDGTLFRLGITAAEWKMVILCLIVVLAADIMKKKGASLAVFFAGRPLAVRWTAYLALILVTVICGVWGGDYDAASFIYYKF